MRHDAHFVEELVKRSSTHVGQYLPLSVIDPNPEQPRTHLGNLDELAASIREKGVLEPILVRAKRNSRFEIISGERRFRAAAAAGLDEIPTIELDADDREALEIALIENIQRKDLTPFEEAEGFQFLQDRFEYTHEQIAKVLGKSRTTVTETLSLNQIPKGIRLLCREAGISSKSILIQIARAGGEDRMIELVDQYASGAIDRDAVRARTSKAPAKRAGRPKNFKYELKDRTLPFRLTMSFRRADVPREELISALETVLERLRNST